MTETPGQGPKVFRGKELLTVREFAIRIGCSRSHVYNLVDMGIDGGGVMAFRYGVRRCVRIPVSEVGRFQQKSLVENV